MQFKLKGTLLLILFAFILLNFGIYSQYHNKNRETKNYKMVNSSTVYYSIINDVNQFIRNSNKENVLIVLDLLDRDYKQKNKINSENVFNYIKAYSDSQYSFIGSTMYSVDINSNVTEYLVKGNIEKQMIDSSTLEKYYVIVKVDNKNNTFSIIPDNGSKYEEATYGI